MIAVLSQVSSCRWGSRTDLKEQPEKSTSQSCTCFYFRYIHATFSHLVYAIVHYTRIAISGDRCDAFQAGKSPASRVTVSSIFNRVDLPLPEGPATDTNSPLFTEKLTLFSDTTLPVEDAYTLVRFSTFIVTEAV